MERIYSWWTPFCWTQCVLLLNFLYVIAYYSSCMKFLLVNVMEYYSPQYATRKRSPSNSGALQVFLKSPGQTLFSLHVRSTINTMKNGQKWMIWYFSSQLWHRVHCWKDLLKVSRAVKSKSLKHESQMRANICSIDTFLLPKPHKLK
jgi:hypothetical protein